MLIRFPPLITPNIAKEILQGEEKVSLDLGLTHTKVQLVGDFIILENGIKLLVSDITKVAKRKDAIFFPKDGSLFQVAISKDHYYKLVPTSGAPTLEIDGIRMHRTKGTRPELDTKEKIKVLGVNCGRVLDTCMGLGYSAIESVNMGAEIVVTVEKNPIVVSITTLNPWSLRLFGDEIHKVLGDSYFVVDSLPDCFFEWIIHDPPRLTLAGHLYSEEFYSKLFRVLAIRGRLFHYTGKPGSKYRGIDLQRGVQRRLQNVGFRNTIYHKGILGVTCEK